MKKARRISALLLLLGFMLTAASGCTLSSVDELYALPQLSEEYVILQQLIDEELASGCEYSAPLSGSYTQVVHTGDLDGDGIYEAIAYLRDAETRAKICIYSKLSGEYELACTIHGNGTAIGSVEYADMDGDGCLELVAYWQGGVANSLNVYSLKDYRGLVLLTTPGTAYRLADMDDDDDYELLVLHTGGAEGSSVDMFDLSRGSMTQSGAKLSVGVVSVDRLRTGLLTDGVRALFAEGSCGENTYMTDIFIADDSGLRNITAQEQSGASTTVREYAVYAADINSDRVLEVPLAVPLAKHSEDSPSYFVFDWYGYDSSGVGTALLSTYHCYSDGWFLVLPDSLRENLTVRRSDSVFGERSVILSHRDPDTGETTDVLTIYTLTGNNRSDRARVGGRFILTELSQTVYAAKLHENAPYSEQEITSGFDLILTEWNSGAL